MDNSEQTPLEASTPEGQIQPELAIPPTPPKRRPSKKIIALIVVCLVIMLAAGLALGWYLFGNETEQKSANKSDTTQTDETQEKAIRALKPEDIIADVQTELETKYTLVDYNENSAPDENEISFYDGEFPPPYRVPGYEFYTNYEGGKSIYLYPYEAANFDMTNTEKEDTIRQTIETVYEKYGLVQKDTVGTEDNGTLLYIYENGSLVCSNSISFGSTEASCGEKTKYNKMAEATKPLYESLIVDNPPSSPLYISVTYIANSKTPGYQKAEAGVGDLEAGGGYTALFYKKNDGPWTFFQGSQETIMCSEYNTTDIKNAFKGDGCYTDTDATIGTVQ